MEAGDTLQVKDGVDQETIDAVNEVSTYTVSYTHLTLPTTPYV